MIIKWKPSSYFIPKEIELLHKEWAAFVYSIDWLIKLNTQNIKFLKYIVTDGGGKKKDA